MAKMRVVFHQMPDNGTLTNIDQRLWYRFRIFTQTRAVSAAKYNDFHQELPSGLNVGLKMHTLRFSG
jgi:hypothetical protein